jgi:hypothetical protein
VPCTASSPHALMRLPALPGHTLQKVPGSAVNAKLALLSPATPPHAPDEP